jgi:hypothetical protein
MFHILDGADGEMPALDKAFFVGSGNPDTRVSATAEILNKGESLTEALELLGCVEASLSGHVILYTTADNNRVENAEFVLRGIIEASVIRIPCHKIWAQAEKGVFLYLTIPDADKYVFENGGLASDYIAQEQLEFDFGDHIEGRAVTKYTAEVARGKNTGDFCIRAVAQLSKSEVTRGIRMTVTILLFPDTKETTLDATDAAAGAGWPGLFVLETECALGPRSTSEWGCPIVPLLKTRTPIADNPRIPSGSEMRRAIGSLMGRSYRPEYYKVGSTAAQKASHYTTHPEEFADKASSVTWPKPAPASAAEKGRL